MMSGMRTAIFIDGPNLHAQEQDLGRRFAYENLQSWIESRGALLTTARYYNTYLPGVRSTVEPLFKWLSSNGYIVIKKQLRKRDNGSLNASAIDTSIVADSIMMATNYDMILFVSGNSSLTPCIPGIHTLGARVAILSTVESCSQELREAADEFIDLSKQKMLFRKEAQHAS